MPRGHPIAPLALDEEAKAQLLSIVRSRAPPHALVRRAQIVLACAAGGSNAAVAERIGLSRTTVGRWRRR